MQAIMESLFDIFYLTFALYTGFTLLRKNHGSKTVSMMGAMCVILGAGDAFHLVPRVMSYWIEGDFTAALGIGTMITSITMAVFYLMLEYVRRFRRGITGERHILCLIWLLTIVRIVLCLFPQNRWTAPDAPLSWGIYRNIPFAITGIMATVCWMRDAGKDKALRLMGLAVLLSFMFYFPVVLFADAVPIIGMLMLPKTIMYIWMMVMFRKAARA